MGNSGMFGGVIQCSTRFNVSKFNAKITQVIPILYAGLSLSFGC